MSYFSSWRVDLIDWIRSMVPWYLFSAASKSENVVKTGRTLCPVSCCRCRMTSLAGGSMKAIVSSNPMRNTGRTRKCIISSSVSSCSGAVSISFAIDIRAQLNTLARLSAMTSSERLKTAVRARATPFSRALVSSDPFLSLNNSGFRMPRSTSALRNCRSSVVI